MTTLDGIGRRERSTGELVKDLSQQATTLARLELELAKTEMAEKGKKAGLGAGMLAGGAVAGLLALGSLTAFLVLVLAEGMPAWAAALLVTAVWAGVAAVLAWQGKEKLDEMGRPVPEKTVESVKEDIEWLKDQTR
jgi:Putative Actinobacterial Holin-X, holin superfamily III